MPSLPDIPALPGLGSMQFPEPDFPVESRRLSLFYVFIAATFLALAGLDLYLRKRRHNRTPAPINRAHRQPADSGPAEHSRPSFGMHRPLSAARTIPDGKPTAENGQRSADGRRRTMGRGL